MYIYVCVCINKYILGVARYTDNHGSVRTSVRGSRFDTSLVQQDKKKKKYTMLGFFSFILNRQ